MTRDDGEQKVARPNQRLREARIHMGLSYEDVAKAIDLPDPRTVGRWERGNNFPRPHYRQKLGELFGKSLEELGLIPQDQDHEQLAQQPISHALAQVPTEIQTQQYTIQSSFTSFVGRDASIVGV